MKPSITVNGEAVRASIEAQSLKGRKTVNVSVSYGAYYAVFVHENLEARHAPPTSAKFLERAAKNKKREMQAVIKSHIVNKNGLEEAAIRAARILFAESQRLVPVDTGYLKSSGIIMIEG